MTSGGKPYTRREIEAALISVHGEYGALIHQKAADALLAALRSSPSDRATGHALFSRLFGEYAATLETHGAWAWSVRNRFDRGSFIDAYLDYKNHEITAFYELVQDHDGDLRDLLRLPSAERVSAAMRPRHPLVTPEDFEEGLAARYKRLKIAADLYFSDDRILIDTYNKTKHGAPMVRIVDPDDPRRFELIVPEQGKAGEERYQLTTFTVTKTSITTLEQNIASMTTSIQELAVLAKLLEMFGLFYERDV